MNTLGVDIGGTKIFVGRYSSSLQLEAEITVPTLADKSQKATLNNLISALKQVQNKDTTSIGIAWAGFVNTDEGQIIKAPNVPQLNNFKICEYVTQHCNLPTLIENDARAFAYGVRSLVALNSKMCLGIIIGTGVGSGLIYNGEIIYGAHGYAGEIGHITRQQKEIEQWLAGPNLKKYLELGSEVNFSDLFPEKKEALQVQVAEPLKVFGEWLAGLVLTFDPDEVIIGGGTGIYFWQHFKTEILQHTQEALKDYPSQFELSFYNEANAGAIGAAKLSASKT